MRYSAYVEIRGMGLLSICALPSLKLRLPTHGKEKTSRSSIIQTRLIDGSSGSATDDSSVRQASELEREINRLKSKSLSLEMAFRKMNSQLRTLQFRDQFREDELADFAAEAAGGAVLETPQTESYYQPKHALSLFGIPLCEPNYFTPRKVIQPWREAGECWAFRGDRGSVKIRLARRATVQRITMEHVSAAASLDGKADTAPKEFLLSTLFDGETVNTEIFVYDNRGQASQIFQITDEKYEKMPISVITLEILSNWGNPNYTCLYRFKVHGRISP